MSITERPLRTERRQSQKSYADVAKLNKAISLLTELRASYPPSLLATTLNIDAEEDAEEVFMGPEPGREEEESEAGSQMACARCKHLQCEVQKYQLDLLSRNSCM